MNMKSRAEWFDISVQLSAELPVWPGGYGFHKHCQQEIGMDSEANVTRLDFDVHSGTHIDAPLHFVAGGKTTSDLPLDVFMGKAVVLDFSGQEVIRDTDLAARNIPDDCAIVLLKTENSRKQWYRHPFDTSFVAIDAGAAKWLVENGIRLIGIDGPSIQKYNDPKDTHVILLQNEVVILEGLNLEGVEEGLYDLICLPISAADCEGVPARAILKKL